jgi:signal transduction histidine kinase
MRRAFMRMVFVCCGAVLLITTTAYFVYDLATFRRASVQQLQTLGEAVASNSTAALAFENSQDATVVLSALRADPHIRAAALYDANGRLFAVYPAELDPALLPEKPGAPGYSFDGMRLAIFQSVTDRSRELGTLYVESDLRAMFARIQLYALVVLVVAALAALAAYLISRLLQQRLMQPIQALADAAHAVSVRQDYGVRAVRTGNYEFDILTDAFNHMLTQVQQSEAKLQSQLARLGLLQHITRAIGDRQDMASIFEVVLGSLEENLPVDFACLLPYERGARSLSVGRVGAASRPQAEEMGIIEGSPVAIDPNGLSRCIAGELAYEPDSSDIPFPFSQRFATNGLRSVVFAPLMFEGVVYGVLACARRATSAFSSGECEFLKQLGEHVALASRQASLYGALQQAYDDLRQSQLTLLQQERLRALGQMASGIAHDINNAISPVALYTESLLEREPNLSDRARAQLASIQQAIEDVARTVSRMREFYRERESLRDQERVNLNRAIQQVVDLTRPMWSDQPQQRGVAIDLRLELAEGLPEANAADYEVRDALTNLVFNAVDAMPAGGVLTLRTRRIPAVNGGEAIVVEVIDTGVGMDEDTRRRCLEPFYTTKGERGSGLGLAMVYGMAQRHGVGLEIDSALGQGTTMRLMFGIAAPREPAPDRVVTAGPGRPLRILLVDDDPMLLKSLRDTLQEDGHEVAATRGGQAGIDAFAATYAGDEKYDIVITDLGMPRIDGRKVAAAIKELSPATPVILLTGWGQRLIATQEAPPHVDRVLSKPPRLPQLRALFAELLP